MRFWSILLTIFVILAPIFGHASELTIQTLIAVLNNTNVQSIITQKEVPKDPNFSPLIFKGIREMSGSVGKCLKCFPEFELLFETAPSGNISRCSVTVKVRPSGLASVDQDQCVN